MTFEVKRVTLSAPPLRVDRFVRSALKIASFTSKLVSLMHGVRLGAW